jgi:hypothetical protein
VFVLGWLIGIAGGLLMGWAGWQEFQAEGGKFQLGTSAPGSTPGASTEPPPPAAEPAATPPSAATPPPTAPAPDTDIEATADATLDEHEDDRSPMG